MTTSTPSTRRAWRTDRPSEAGSIAVELVILAPLVGLLLAGIVLVGRVQSTRADIEAAARAAARDLSLARDVRAAIPDARSLVDSMLQVGSSSCRRASLRTEITPTDITVTVVCQVGLRDVAVLPVSGSMRISATATEPVDLHVEHSP